MGLGIDDIWDLRLLSIYTSHRIYIGQLLDRLSYTPYMCMSITIGPPQARTMSTWGGGLRVRSHPG